MLKSKAPLSFYHFFCLNYHLPRRFASSTYLINVQRFANSLALKVIQDSYSDFLFVFSFLRSSSALGSCDFFEMKCD